MDNGLGIGGGRSWLAIGLATVMLVVSGTAAHGQESVDPEFAAFIRAEQVETENLRAWLVTQSDADSLAAAALATPWSNTIDAALLLEHAASLEPTRPELVWLQLRLCVRNTACDAQALENRLHELDPENGASLLDAAERARSRGDERGRREARGALAHAQRIDIYWTTLIAHLSRAVARRPETSLQDATSTVIGMLAARDIPPFQAITSDCRKGVPRSSDAIDICRGVAAALQHGDTIIGAALGDSIAMRVWPQDSPEYRAAEADHQAIMNAVHDGQPHAEWAAAHPADYLAKLANTRREQDLAFP